MREPPTCRSSRPGGRAAGPAAPGRSVPRASRQHDARGSRRTSRQPASWRPPTGRGPRAHSRSRTPRAPRRARRPTRPVPTPPVHARWPRGRTPGAPPRAPGRATAGRPRPRRRRAARTRSPRGPDRSPRQDDRIALGGECRPDERLDVVEQPHDADLWRRGDRPRGFVVERDVAARDRQAERPARVGEPAHPLAELPERRWPGGVAVVQAVRDAERTSAGDRDVAGGLGDAQRGAEPRVEGPDRLVGIGRRDERLGRAAHAQDRRPWPGPATVSAPTVESYCSKTARREARFGEPTSASRTAPGSMPRSGSRSLITVGRPVPAPRADGPAARQAGDGRSRRWSRPPQACGQSHGRPRRPRCRRRPSPAR